MSIKRGPITSDRASFLVLPYCAEVLSVAVLSAAGCSEPEDGCSEPEDGWSPACSVVSSAASSFLPPQEVKSVAERNPTIIRLAIVNLNFLMI